MIGCTLQVTPADTDRSARRTPVRGTTALLWRHRQQFFSAPQRIQAIDNGLSGRLLAHMAWLWKWRRGDPSIRLIEALVRPGDNVLDVGASWGIFTNRLAELVGTEGQVHSFEPLPANWGSLESIRRGRPQVALHKVALSDKDGYTRLHVPIIEGRRIITRASLSVPRDRTGAAHEVVPIQVKRLDGVLPESGPLVAFVKCDAEGHELPVLLGGEAILRRSRPVLLLEIEQRHQVTKVDETFDYLAGMGYVGYAIRGKGLMPLEEFDIQRHQLDLLGPGYVAGAKPKGYLNDFLFLPVGMDMRSLVTWAREW